MTGAAVCLFRDSVLPAHSPVAFLDPRSSNVLLCTHNRFVPWPIDLWL